MNDNFQLEPGEVILVMRTGCKGKTIKGTRVFTDGDRFRSWFLDNRVHLKADGVNQRVGDVLSKWNSQELKITQLGYYVNCENIFVASEEKDPKKLKLSPAMFGLPEYKVEWVDIT